MMTRQQKEIFVREISEKIKSAKSSVFVDFQGLNVSDTREMKKNLRQSGIEYIVMKKRLFDRGAKEVGLAVNASKIKGQFAVAFSYEDEVSAAKILENFSKKGEKISLVGGILEGKELNQEEILALAKIPSKQELLSKLVGSLNAPASRLVGVLSGTSRSFVLALKAIADQKM